MAFLDSIDLGLIEFTFFCSVILFASIVRGFSGFGFSASSVSLLSFILPAKEIVPIILLLEIIASFLMFLFGKKLIGNLWSTYFLELL